MSCPTSISRFQAASLWIFAFLIQSITETTTAFVIPQLLSSSPSTPSFSCVAFSKSASTRNSLSQQYPNSINSIILFAASTDTEAEGQPSVPPPQTFREAEILGLRLMQEGQHEQALEGSFLLSVPSLHFLLYFPKLICRYLSRFVFKKSFLLFISPAFVNLNTLIHVNYLK